MAVTSEEVADFLVWATQHMGNRSSRYWKLVVGIKFSEELQVPNKRELGVLFFYEDGFVLGAKSPLLYKKNKHFILG